jgi:Domain of unknown function (DUF4407)
MLKTNQETRIIRSKVITKIILFCLGVDADVLLRKNLSTECRKYESLGFLVLNASILSAISAGYFILLVFSSTSVSVFCGLFWGLFRFSIYRYSILSVNGKRKRNAFSTSLLLFFHLLFASSIALMNVKPVELRLFDSEINVQIASQNSGSKSGSTSISYGHENSLFSRILALEQLSDNYPSIRINRMVITLLFILLDVMPIVFIFCLRPGLYEAIVNELEMRIYAEIDMTHQLERERQEYKYKVHQGIMNTLDLELSRELAEAQFRSKMHDRVSTSLDEISFELVQSRSPYITSASTQKRGDSLEIEEVNDNYYEQVIRDLEAKYDCDIQAKNREIEIYKKYSNELERISDKLASQPIDIDANQYDMKG